jgi:hypothetical protein
MKCSDCLAAIALAVSLGMGPAQGQAAGAATGSPAGKIEKPTDLRGEWIRNGPGFACKVAPGQRLPHEWLKPEILSRACQHMGPFVVGQEAAALTTVLGAPHQTRPAPNGRADWMYFLGQREHYPYLVARIFNDRIVTLQVTGPSAAQGYSISVQPPTRWSAISVSPTMSSRVS